MSTFAAWGLTVLGLATVTTIAEMLLPQGKLRKVIRSVFATVAVFVIITPIPSMIKNGIDFDFTSDAVEYDDGYLDYVSSLQNELLEKSVTDYLAQKGYSGGFEIKVDSVDYKVQKVTVDFSDSGITENGAHINKSEIKGLIADYFDIGEEAIMTYG